MGALIEDRDAGHIRWQQIGGELDALETASDRTRDSFGEHGFACARHVFEEYVPFAQQRGEHLLDGMPLSDDNALDIGGDAFNRGFDVVHSGIPVQMFTHWVVYHAACAHPCL
jgi:hypothetical protein